MSSSLILALLHCTVYCSTSTSSILLCSFTPSKKKKKLNTRARSTVYARDSVNLHRVIRCSDVFTQNRSMRTRCSSTCTVLSMVYLCIYLAACSVCRLNVPENTPIQSITRSARAHWQLTPILDSKLQESTLALCCHQETRSTSLGNSCNTSLKVKACLLR